MLPADNHQELAVLGTTAHTCTFHSEGYRWRDPTTDPRAEKLSEVCDTHGDGQCTFASVSSFLGLRQVVWEGARTTKCRAAGCGG